jgi:Tfp pilus assembly protein PilF
MYREAERLNPAKAESAHNLAVAQWAAGDLQSAISQLNRAVSLDPYYERSWLLLTNIYTQLGQVELRAATIERYLKLVPQNLTFRVLQRKISTASPNR